MSTDVRTRILDAARGLIDTLGLPALTQPKVARAAGVRQSHLTYYFPRRVDLLSALLAQSHRSAESTDSKGDFFDQLAAFLFEPRHTRFFLAVVVETCDDPESRDATAGHMHGFACHLAASFDRSPDDAAVQALVAQFRGLSIQNLDAPDRSILSPMTSVRPPHA